MYLPDIELHQATSLSEASRMLQHYGSAARLLAGGTDLLVDLKAKRVSASHLISIHRIPELKRITLANGTVRIGALTTITELGESAVIRRGFTPILDATKSMAVRQIRNLATVGGNLASAVPCADLPPILIAMNASVTLWSPAQERTIPLETLFLAPRRTACQRDEILSVVIVPAMADRFGVAYARFGMREGNAIAVAAVAAGILLAADGTVREAKIVLGAVAPIPKLAVEAAELLVGSAPTDDLFASAANKAVTEADPICDVRGSADFRRKLVEVLTKRALAKALQRAGGVEQ